MWFVFWLLILFLLFSGGGYYGYQRSYYGRSTTFGWVGLLIVIFLILALWGGPHWGYYNSYW